MKHRLFHNIHAMTEAQLDAYAKARELDLPEQFCCSDPRQAKAEYICNALDLTDPDDALDIAHDRGVDVGSELDAAATAWMEKHGGTYSDALAAVLERNPGLARRYAKSFGKYKTGRSV